MRRYAILFDHENGLYLNDIVVCCELVLWEMTQQGLAVDMSFCGTSSPGHSCLQPIMREKQLTTPPCQILRRQQHCRNIQLKQDQKSEVIFFLRF
jgi:hypothetical protein